MGTAEPLDHVGGRAEVTIERRKIMEHAISFPALGLDFNINRVAVNLFGKDIYWYGIIICLGFVLGVAKRFRCCCDVIGWGGEVAGGGGEGF